MKNIIKFINTARLYLFGAAFLKYFLLWFLLSYCFLVVWSAADYLFVFQILYRKIYYFIVLLCAVYFSFRFLWTNRAYFKYYGLILQIQKNIPELKDDLINSWQLHNSLPQGISNKLVEKLIENTEEKIKIENPLSIVNIKSDIVKPLGYILTIVFITAFIFLYPGSVFKTSLKRVLFSFSQSNWSASFSVEPGTKKYPYTSQLSIIVKEKQAIKGLPWFFVRSVNGRWQKSEMESDPAKNEYIYSIDKLTEGLEYFVSWGDLETEVFSLLPVMVPQLGDFFIKCRYPKYTGLGAVEIKGNPNISALKGTVVAFSAKASKDLKSAELFIDNKKYPVSFTKDKISADFLIEKSCVYRFLLEAVDGSINADPPHYLISINEDQPPRIELVSPNQDLVVAGGSEIPLVFNASDDFALTKLKLHYKIDKNEDSQIEINSQAVKTFQDTYEFIWKTARLDLKPSQKVQYYLEAFDNDTVNGPKSGVSSTYSFEVSDYEKEHEGIEASLKEFRNKLLDILADETVARAKTESLKTNYSTSTYQSLNAAQKNIQEPMRSPLELLNKLLSKMETDPYTDFSTYSEYKGLNAHLENMKENPMTAAIKALEAKNWDAAKASQDEIIANLEKISLLSEDIWQYQKMQDLLDKGGKLEKTGLDLTEQLASAPQPEELKKVLSEMKELLAEINKQLTKLPKELPEDFVNSPAVKNIDLKSSQDLLGELSDAIAKGDWEKAKGLAKALNEKLSSMLKTLDGAGKDIGFSSNRVNQVQEKLQKQNEELSKIIKEQEDMNKAVEKMDNLSRKALFKQQEDMLKLLSLRQKTVLSKAGSISQKARAYYWKFQDTENLMKKVLNEFELKRVFHSQKYLEDIIVDAASLKSRVLPLDSQEAGEEFKNTVSFILNEEQAILEALKQTATNDVFSQNEKIDVQELGKGQTGIAKKTKDIRNDLEEFMRFSASVNPAISENLYFAQKEMETGAHSLGKLDTLNALESGSKALEYLQASKNSIDSAKEQLANQGKNAGKPVGSRIQVRTGSGASGFATAPVKLPRIDEYKPPREFRQEIMDALKEKFPAEYEKIIKDYYRKLTE